MKSGNARRINKTRTMMPPTIRRGFFMVSLRERKYEGRALQKWCGHHTPIRGSAPRIQFAASKRVEEMPTRSFRSGSGVITKKKECTGNAHSSTELLGRLRLAGPD